MSEEKFTKTDYPESAFDGTSDSSSDVEKVINVQIAQESGHAVKYRTCSWQKVRTPCTSHAVT